MNIEDLTKETRLYIVREADLKALIEGYNAIAQQLERIEAKLNPVQNNGHELLTAKDVLKDLGISRKSLDRRLYKWDNPIPMVLDGKRLKIRRDKYENWKHSIGL